MRYSGSTAGIDAAGLGLCVAIAAGVYMLGVLPGRESAQAAARDREVLSERHRDIVSLEAELATDKQLLERLRGLAATDQVQNRTPLDRISRMSELAAISGVTLTEVSPRPVQAGVKYNQNPLVLTGSGRSPGFMTLLDALHHEFSDTQVVSLTITGNPEQRLLDQAMSAELVWYTLAAPGGKAGSAGAPNAQRP